MNKTESIVVTILVIACLILLSMQIKELQNRIIVLENKHITHTKQNVFDTSSVYYNGEILYPDMAHDDTLVVFNAKQLNRIFDGVNTSILPTTDEEIDEVLHMYAISTNFKIIDILPSKDKTYQATLIITH